jgi:chromosome segregation ATPase
MKLTPMELMERLVALVPRPRVHLTRYHGVLGPHYKHRKQIVPKPPELKVTGQEQDIIDPKQLELKKKIGNEKIKTNKNLTENEIKIQKNNEEIAELDKKINELNKEIENMDTEIAKLQAMILALPDDEPEPNLTDDSKTTKENQTNEPEKINIDENRTEENSIYVEDFEITNLIKEAEEKVQKSKTEREENIKKLEEEVDKDILNYYIKIIDFINNSDKKELIIHAHGKEILCAYIRFGEELDDDNKLNKMDSYFLTTGNTKEDLEEFLNSIDKDYDSGYGSQELFGTIWYKDGTWSTRGEYDGSEWWQVHKCPLS